MEKKIKMDTKIDPELEKLFGSFKPEFEESFSQDVMARLDEIQSEELFDKQLGKYSLRTALIGIAAIAAVLIIIVASQGTLNIDSLIGVEQLNEMEFSSLIMEDSPF